MRLNISIDKQLLDKVDIYCEDNRYSRSALIAELLREKITQDSMPFGATSIMRGEPLAPGTSPYLKSAADIRGNEEEENISMDEINEMERKAKEKTEYFGMVQPKDLDNS